MQLLFEWMNFLNEWISFIESVADCTSQLQYHRFDSLVFLSGFPLSILHFLYLLQLQFLKYIFFFFLVCSTTLCGLLPP
jgi:hypothetical protein